jgi:hypothetical protein
LGGVRQAYALVQRMGDAREPQQQAAVAGSPPRKINLISCGPLGHVSDIKLIRTDTTLDLSQKAEKGMSLHLGSCSFCIMPPFELSSAFSDVGYDRQTFESGHDNFKHTKTSALQEFHIWSRASGNLDFVDFNHRFHESIRLSWILCWHLTKFLLHKLKIQSMGKKRS